MNDRSNKKDIYFLTGLCLAFLSILVIRSYSNMITLQPNNPMNTGKNFPLTMKNGPASMTIPPKPILARYIERVLIYLYRNINPDTGLAYSFPGDRRLKYWSVTYDDCMRALAHIKTGDTRMARVTLNYFMENTAIQKRGWYVKNGKTFSKPGWVINIVDASIKRSGGRGIEHIAHTGPNAYLGIVSLHLYLATGDQAYLDYAKSRWGLIKDLQNENPNDPNYGGVRMGPLGDTMNPREQKLEFKEENPSFYNFYNGEHAADFKALCDLLARVDTKNSADYLRASRLIAIWDHRIYDPQKHLFFIGTTEKKFYESNIGQWVNPGIIPMYPLDTNALKISAYGVNGLEQFEKNGAEKIREAIEANFRVTVTTLIKDKPHTMTGYDFVCHADRKRLIFFEEKGPEGDIKVNEGIGREPMITDEWSNWVALADLRLAKDFKRLGNPKKSSDYLYRYKRNAFDEAMQSGDDVGQEAVAYPYAHPIPSGFNKPVGFGWNTHHEPYCMIAGSARILGMLGADPFSLDPNLLDLPIHLPNKRLAISVTEDPNAGLMTEAETYINRAWAQVHAAQKRHGDEEDRWNEAVGIIERMNAEHADWSTIAAKQNLIAKNSDNPFPLLGEPVKRTEELEPIFGKYWALYHVGTGEFIRVMAYKELAYLARSRHDLRAADGCNKKAHEAAENIVNKYFYSQAYDKTGWLWQPVRSLKEYFDEYDSIL